MEYSGVSSLLLLMISLVLCIVWVRYRERQYAVSSGVAAVIALATLSVGIGWDEDFRLVGQHRADE